MKKTLLLSTMVLLMLPGLVFAQRTATQSTAPTTFQLTIQVTPPNAAIFVDGAQIKGNVAVVPAGPHQVMTKAGGFLDFVTTVNVQGNMTLPVKMQPATFPLSVNAANVKGAQVLLNGNPVGQTPYNGQLQPGSYTVTVQAPGFIPYSESFALGGPKAINVTLQPATAQLTFNVTPPNAVIIVDNAQIKGNVITVPLGLHSVRITAPGYLDYSGNVNVTANETLTIPLTPAMATLSINLQAANINTSLGGNHWNQIQIFIDGTPQKGPMLQVPAGRRLVKIVSGGLQVEQYVDFMPGQTVTFEPVLGLNIKK